MIVIHIESGLGNQMLSYCELLALKKIHPEEDFFLETIVYELPECNDYICQWNGYELGRIFGIADSNIKSQFREEQWTHIIDSVRKSEFWKKYWNYPVYICEAFKEEGCELHNIRGDFEKNHVEFSIAEKGAPPLKYKIKQTGFYYNMRRLYHKLKRTKLKSDIEWLFYTGEENIFTGQRLSFKFLSNNIEEIEEEIKNTFVFPELSDDNNLSMAIELQHCNSVAIHARRGDMLSVNRKYFTGGYFRRAVRYIKRHVENPVFIFFCDPGSIEWCKENEHVFGLDFGRDEVRFVDWNSGDQSFRDMQLMTMCKHNIITNSSFGWWGAYLNVNPSKITISPEPNINTTYHC